jgi:hypothetical protein
VDRSAAARLAEPKPIVLVADDEPIVLASTRAMVEALNDGVVTPPGGEVLVDAGLTGSMMPPGVCV